MPLLPWCCKMKVHLSPEEGNKLYSSVDNMVKTLFGATASVLSTAPVHGGDINDAYRVSLSTGDYIFLKTNSAANVNFFLTEAAGLQALRSSGKIGVPRILGAGTDAQKGISFLALEFIEGAPRIASYWETFGHQLAELHRAEFLSYENRFGFHQDNYIGASPQKNQPCEKWIDFYRECRLLPQLAMAERYLDPSFMKKADHILEHLDSYLREPDFPSLLHGDLWSGNMLCGPDGKAWIIDPAAYVGDFEADLAMTQLFGSLPERFYDAYSEVNPVDWKGYRERKGLYDLYHLLNHLNLFGRGYLRSVVEIIERYTGAAD